MNALAFSGSNYLFTILRSSGVDEERKRHDKAVEQLQAATHRRHGPRSGPSAWTINEEFVGEAMP